MMPTVLSQREELETKESLGVNTTSHETVLLVVTETVELEVDRVTGEAAPLKVKVSAARRIVPVQLPPSCSVNDSDPLKGAAEVTVAESFGSHVCAEDVDDVVDTVKHSLSRLSLEAR